MISYEQAIKILLETNQLCSSIITVEKSLFFAANKTIKSNVFVPSFANSAMDGFAIKSSDISKATKENPISLKIVGSTVAGDEPSKGKSGAWEIMTGAPVPPFYDSVVKIEDINVNGEFARFSSPVPIGNNIRRAGEDFSKGDEIIKAGTLISSNHIMALASIGEKNISINNKPRISVFSTGKEIIDNADLPLEMGQIRNSNSPYLLAAFKEINLNATYAGIIHDEPEIFEAELSTKLENNDIIISTGAVSMGKHDFIPDSLHKLGAKILFHKVFIRPGKPILYAYFPSETHSNGTHYFGLPGNPISAAVGFRFFIVPLINHLQGIKPEQPLKAKLLNPSVNKIGFRFFKKAHVKFNDEGKLFVDILQGQQSFKIKSLLKANCWASFPAQSSDNELIDIYPLTPNKWDF